MVDVSDAGCDGGRRGSFELCGDEANGADMLDQAVANDFTSRLASLIESGEGLATADRVECASRARS